MKKELIIFGIIKLIERVAKENNLEVNNKGIGHGFDNTLWKGIAKDDSNIPEIIASKEGYSIGLRSFWGSPEVCIRRTNQNGEDLLIFRYTDNKKTKNGNYKHTGYYHIGEVRVDCSYRSDYKNLINEVYDMIGEVESYQTGIYQKVLKAILLLRKFGNKYQTKEEQIAEQFEWLSTCPDYTESKIDEWICSLKEELQKTPEEREEESRRVCEELAQAEAEQEYEERMSMRHDRDEWDDYWDDRAKSVGAKLF